MHSHAKAHVQLYNYQNTSEKIDDVFLWITWKTFVMSSDARYEADTDNR